jgi:hypothetical protein
VLQAHRVRAGLLARGRQALEEPQRDEEDRRGDADGVVARQAPDEERRGAHEQEGEDEDLLAAEAVADVSEDDRADRAGGVADAESGEGEQGPGRGVRGGEEDLAEHEGGGGPVDEEVVVLQGGADPGGDGGLPGGAPVLRGLRGGVVGHGVLLRLCAIAWAAGCSHPIDSTVNVLDSYVLLG